MIAIIDYGVGNLYSLLGSLRRIGKEAAVTADPEQIRAADRIILPGVGAFGDAMARLRDTGLVPLLLDQAQRKPLLGICLGMQLLFERSYEYGEHTGLGLLRGSVVPLAEVLGPEFRIPHMGWNALRFPKPSPLFRYTREGEYVYYVHSFYATDCEESVIATSEYGIPVTGAVQSGSVFGTQFHPEKSGETGLGILRAFSEI